MTIATLIPLAHIGHWLWVSYMLPVLIVVGGIVASTRAARRREPQGGGEERNREV